MPAIDTRVDDYISKSAEFARPVLNHLRAVIHKACPALNETMKWSFPHFEYANNILCSMAAFKQHCAFTFWRGSLMQDPDQILAAAGEKTSMGHFGPIKSMADLPPEEVMIKYIKAAMALTEKGAKIPKKEKLLPQTKLKFLLIFSMLYNKIIPHYTLLKTSVPLTKKSTWNG